MLEQATKPEGDRPRRHRRRQRRCSGRDRARHHRDEHAVRQFDHHRRARHRADAGAGAPDSRRRRFDPAPANGRRTRFMGVEISGKTLGVIGCGNIGSIVADRAHRPEDEGGRLRSVPSAERALDLGVEKVELDELFGAPISSRCTRRSPTRPETSSMPSRSR